MLRLAIRRFPKGNEGKRVSSGYNRRRRLAPRSSGKQQAERTAVRTAPIVCPEESPLVRPQAHTPALVRRLPEGGAGGNEGKTQGGLPLGNPVCLWQTELFKLNLKSSPSSSGYNRRRRLATRSSGKQQAGRTAVRATPIVCPEESPLLVSISDNFAVKNSPLAGLDAPTPARIGTGRPMGRSHFSFGGERKVCKRKPAARRLREKALYCPFLKEGVRNVARSTVGLPT